MLSLQVGKPKSFIEKPWRRKKSFVFPKLLAAFSKGSAPGLHQNRVLCASSTPYFSELNFSTIWSFSLDIYFQPFWQRKVCVLLKHWHCVTKEDLAILPLLGMSWGRWGGVCFLSGCSCALQLSLSRAFPCCPQSCRLEDRGHASQVDDASPSIYVLVPVNGWLC